MSTFSYCSEIPNRYHKDLEHLLFFNPRQEHVRTKIMEVVRKYGSPRIVEHGENLRVVVGGHADAQSLFVLHDAGKHARLAGIVIFAREGHENILVQHIAVRPPYSSAGKFAREMLVLKIIDKLKAIAHSIRGVKYITLVYGKGSSQSIRV